MTDLDKSVLIAFAENQMNKSKTGEALFMHRNTIDYHLKKVKEETGKDPNDFFELASLLGMVEVRNVEWKPTYHNYYNRDGVCQIADEWHCSECEIYSRNEWNYCPNCGAKMDGKDKNHE
jgi:hypothetical protein